MICRELKNDILTLHIQVILISGTHDLFESLQQQGAPNDFLSQPFDLDDLLHKVNAQLVLPLLLYSNSSNTESYPSGLAPVSGV